MTDQPASYQPSPPPEATPTRKTRGPNRLPRGKKKKVPKLVSLPNGRKIRKTRVAAAPASHAAKPATDLFRSMEILAGLSPEEGKVLVAVIGSLKEVDRASRARVIDAFRRLA